MKALGILTALCLGFAQPAYAACDTGESVIRVGPAGDLETSLTGASLVDFAARANTVLEGQACVEVSADAPQSGAAVMTALTAGELHLAALDLRGLATRTPAFGLFELPFLFSDLGHVQRFVEAPAGQDIFQSLREEGALGLAVWPDGIAHLITENPVTSPGDLDGMPLRVPWSGPMAEMVRALGAVAVPMALSEVRGAWDSGLIAGHGNLPEALAQVGVPEEGAYLTQTSHGLRSAVVLASAEWFDALDPALRETLLSLLDAVTAEHQTRVEAAQAAALGRLSDAGVTQTELSAADREAWRDAVRPVWETHADSIGPERIAAALAVQ